MKKHFIILLIILSLILSRRIKKKNKGLITKIEKRVLMGGTYTSADGFKTPTSPRPIPVQGEQDPQGIVEYIIQNFGNPSI